MSYNAKQLTRLGGTAYAAGNVKSRWMYASADTLAAILAAGYFNSATKRLNQGDIIEIVAGVGGTLERASLQVTSAKAAATVVVRSNNATNLVNLTAGASLTQQSHANKLLTLNSAAGIAIVLPAATGTGDKYELVIGTTVTSSATTIKVANSTDIMAGLCIQSQDGGSTVQAFEAGAADDTITMDGSTRGGIKGDRITLRDIAAGLWQVEMVAAGTGTEATPFSSTV